MASQHDDQRTGHSRIARTLPRILVWFAPGRNEMLKIELVPDLSSCIETVAKKEYREALGKLLREGEGDRELQERVELLRVFLEAMDFRKLRAESEKPLLQGKKVKFTIYLEGDKPKYSIRVE